MRLVSALQTRPRFPRRPVAVCRRTAAGGAGRAAGEADFARPGVLHADARRQGRPAVSDLQDPHHDPQLRVADRAALVALLVKLTSRGPVFYTQSRVGKDGRLFQIYKIRTMIHNCESLTGPRWSRCW